MLPVLDFFRLYEAGDRAAFAAHFHPDFYYIDPEGKAFDKDTYVSVMMDHYMPMASWEITQIRDNINGQQEGDLAVASYISLILFAGQEGQEAKPTRETTVYKRHQGQWLLYYCMP